MECLFGILEVVSNSSGTVSIEIDASLLRKHKHGSFDHTKSTNKWAASKNTVCFDF